MPCEHESFIAETRVGKTAATAEITRWAVDLRVRCAECSMLFRFVGTPERSPDGISARLPIDPAYLVEDGDPAMISLGPNEPVVGSA